MTPENRNPKKTFGVYMPHQLTSEMPGYRVELQEARRLKKENLAYFINHGKDIRLTKAAKEFLPAEMRDEKERWIVKPSGCQVLNIAPVSVWQLA